MRKFFHTFDNSTLNFQSNCIGEQFHKCNAWQVAGVVEREDGMHAAVALVSYDTVVALYVAPRYGCDSAPQVVLFSGVTYSRTTMRQVTRWLTEMLGFSVCAADIRDMYTHRAGVNAVKMLNGHTSYKVSTGDWVTRWFAGEQCDAVFITQKAHTRDKQWRDAPWYGMNVSIGGARGVRW